MRTTKSMNKVQKAYAMAKAQLEARQDICDHAEEEYINANGIRNKDGSIPKRLWMMDDDEAFDMHNERFGKIAEERGLEEKINIAREALQKAEEDLIAFGLSIAPAGKRETLRKGVDNMLSIRQKFIDATYRLNVSSLTA